VIRQRRFQPIVASTNRHPEVSVSHPRHRRLSIAAVGAGLIALMAAAATDAHVVKDFGPYSVALGWVSEPTYVGQINAVQVVVKDKNGKAVTDLEDGDLKVVVGVGGQTSPALALLNKFDPDTGLGVPGDYEAPITPTVPGDYTFHLTGSIHGTSVDETATSSDSTFNSVIESTDIQFPTKLPSLAEMSTRLDRIDARLAPASPAPAAASAAPAPSDATAGLADSIASAQAAASQAKDSASTALIVGIVVGLIGIVLGATALWMVRRPRPQA
jgi:hypothetical protein